MNEYQCRNYIAEQILEEVGKKSLQRRLGEPFDDVYSKNAYPRSQNLYDVGSTNYQEWLSK